MRERKMPERLVKSALESDRGEWLRNLPGLVESIEGRWKVDVSDPFEPGGQTAWVAPARDATGTELVLKVMWRHMEAEDEASGLQEWDGDGTVLLYRAEKFDDTTVMLLEPCRPGTSLASQPETEQDTVVAGLLVRLWRQVTTASFRPLQLMCDSWAEQFEERYAHGEVKIDAGLARAGVALFRELPGNARRNALLSTDLHAENVLAAEREPWLAIDPKPFFGDPCYDVLQHMLNCQERLRADPRGLARRMAGLVDLDPDRVLLWLFARCVQESPNYPALGELARRVAPA